MNKYSTEYAEHQQKIKTAESNRATAEFLEITLDEFLAKSRVERAIATAACNGIVITESEGPAHGTLRWDLTNKHGASGQLTRDANGSYHLEVDGFEAEEAQHGKDAYRKNYGWIGPAMANAIHLLS